MWDLFLLQFYQNSGCSQRGCFHHGIFSFLQPNVRCCSDAWKQVSLSWFWSKICLKSIVICNVNFPWTWRLLKFWGERRNIYSKPLLLKNVFGMAEIRRKRKIELGRPLHFPNERNRLKLGLTSEAGSSHVSLGSIQSSQMGSKNLLLTHHCFLTLQKCRNLLSGTRARDPTQAFRCELHPKWSLYH